MSRTKRSQAYEWQPNAFRHPKTMNEISQLEEILIDDDLEEYEISGVNRIKKKRNHLPTAWDDQVMSSYYQEDHA